MVVDPFYNNVDYSGAADNNHNDDDFVYNDIDDIDVDNGYE